MAQFKWNMWFNGCTKILVLYIFNEWNNLYELLKYIKINTCM